MGLPLTLVNALADPRLSGLCTRYGVRELRIFGSALRADFSPESDIDIFLTFKPGIDPDLFELGGMQQELSAIFGREVDLKTPEMFSPMSLQRVMNQSQVGYAA